MASTSVRAIVAAAGFLVLGVAFPTASRAEDGLIGSFMSLLGLDDDKPEIDYRERAPLVVPPKMDLRPPEESLADKTTNWPQDPDVQRRKQIEAQKRQPGGLTQEEKRRLNGDRAALTEMQAGRGTGGKVRGLPAEQDTFDDSKNKRADWLNPGTLAAESRAAELAAVKPGVEPERRYLTDPPTGYRKPSANAEYKAPKVGPKFKEEDSSPLSAYKKAAPEE
jgi:hypothetical protein